MKRTRGAALWMLMLGVVTSVRAEDVKSLAQGNNAFAWDMYDKLKGEEGNLFFSPFSLRTALAMTYAGAGGETAREMEKALRFAPEDATVHASLAETIQGLEPKGARGYQLSVANSLWGQKGFEFLKPFLEVCKRYYGSGLTEVDFGEKEGEQARGVINQWVEDKTQKKIQNLIPKGVLNQLTRLVLVNAVWFKGDWLNRFSKSETREEAFYKVGKTTVRAPLMHRLGSGYRYAEADGVQILEMPYQGDRLSMVVLLPKERQGLARLEGMLSSKKVDEWLGRLEPKAETDVFFPKFKLTYGTKTLNEQLIAMGMTSAFADGADFSGLTPKVRLGIQAVLHKAFVDVNEEGTEAAAATAVIVYVLSTGPTPTPTFRADHPFIFMIRENLHGNILFLGRLVNP